MIKHLNTFKGIVNQLTKLDMKIDDKLRTLLLLSFLPESWDTLVVTLSNFSRDEKLAMDSVTNSLLNEESIWREQGFNNQFKANIVDSIRRSKNCERGGRRRPQVRFKSCIRLSFYYCGKPDHKRPKCIFLKRDQLTGIVHPDLINPKKNKEYGTTIVIASNDESIFLIGDDNDLNVAFDDCTWIVDT